MSTPQRQYSTEDVLNTLRKFLELNRDQYHVLRLGIFGSFARGEFTSDSDIDVFFETDQPNLLRTIEMKQVLEEMFGLPVDIVRLHRHLDPSLLQQIQRDALYA